MKAYAGRHVDIKYKLLQALLDLLEGHVVIIYKGRAVCVKGRPGLSARRLSPWVVKVELTICPRKSADAWPACSPPYFPLLRSRPKEAALNPSPRSRGRKSPNRVYARLPLSCARRTSSGYTSCSQYFFGKGLADIVVQAVDALLHIGVFFDVPVLIPKIVPEHIYGSAHQRVYFAGRTPLSR